VSVNEFDCLICFRPDGIIGYNFEQEVDPSTQIKSEAYPIFDVGNARRETGKQVNR
jgi:hypothetical protein